MERNLNELLAGVMEQVIKRIQMNLSSSSGKRSVGVAGNSRRKKSGVLKAGILKGLLNLKDRLFSEYRGWMTMARYR